MLRTIPGFRKRFYCTFEQKSYLKLTIKALDRREPSEVAAKQTESTTTQNTVFINKQKVAVKWSPDNRFPLSSSPCYTLWYFIVDNARLQSSQLLAEQWKIKLKWALNWLDLCLRFLFPFHMLKQQRVGREWTTFRGIFYWDNSLLFGAEKICWLSIGILKIETILYISISTRVTNIFKNFQFYFSFFCYFNLSNA